MLYFGDFFSFISEKRGTLALNENEKQEVSYDFCRTFDEMLWEFYGSERPFL